MSTPVLFLDRDDTLVYDEGYMSRPEQLVLLPGVSEALNRARRAGCKLFLVTNQSGIGRGYYTMADAEACNRRLEQLLFGETGAFDGICIAPERPDEPSRYRKPSPAYVLEQIATHGFRPEDCLVVGDKASDLACGVAAGVPAALVARGASGRFREDALAYARENGLMAEQTLAAVLATWLPRFFVAKP